MLYPISISYVTREHPLFRSTGYLRTTDTSHLHMQDSYTIITWNVRGFGSIYKRHRINAQLKRQHVHIVFLQESHLTATEAAKLRRKWKGQVFSTSYSAFARGASIWLSNGVPFKVLEQRTDTLRRYILVRGTLDGRHVVLGSIYFPNFEQDTFLLNLNPVLTSRAAYPWILGGDYNAVLDIGNDQSHPPL